MNPNNPSRMVEGKVVVVTGAVVSVSRCIFAASLVVGI
eukprot:gene16602-20289_t